MLANVCGGRATEDPIEDVRVEPAPGTLGPEACSAVATIGEALDGTNPT